MKKNVLLLVFVLLIASFAGCSASTKTRSESATAQTEAINPEMEIYDEATMDDMVVAEEPAAAPNINTGGGGVDTRNISADARKIVITKSLSLQTVEFDQAVADVEALVESFEGYFESSNVQGSGLYEKYYTRSADFSARVPTERLEEFTAAIQEKFHVSGESQYSEDISDNYYDVDARLKSLRIQEERLLEMLEQATELEYLIEVQKALSEVQYEIDSLTTSLQRMDKSVSMSTVHIYLQEVTEYQESNAAPTTFSQRMLYTFGDSWTNFVDFWQNALLLLIFLLPFLIIAVVIIIAIVIARKKRRKKKDAPPPAQPPTSPENGQP